MILLLALGIGFGWMRSFRLSYLLWMEIFETLRSAQLTKAQRFQQGLYLARLAWPLGFVLSCALFTLNLRPPRPRSSRLCRQPGFVASAAVVLAGGLFAFECLLGWIVRQATGMVAVGPVDRFEKSLYLRPTAPGLIGLMVVASWAMLLLGRRWRPEAAAIDRIGRVLGAYWVLMFVTCTWFILGIL